MPDRALVFEPHQKLMYAANVQMVAQQKRNRLAAAVTVKPAKGQAMTAADLMAAGEYQIAEDRSRRNPEITAKRSRRWLVRPPEIESGDYIDDEDKFDTIDDPTNELTVFHTTNVTMGQQDRMMGVRKVDGTYVVADGGILGNAIEGRTPGAAIALPGSQIIPHGSTGLSIAKLREMRKALRKADFGVEDDDPMYGAITPDEEDDLLAIAEASATPLNAFNIEQLRDGKVSRLMGVNWIMTNRLPMNAAGTARLCPFWTKKNIVAGEWQALVGNAWNDPHAKNKPYIHVKARLDVTRIEDKGVIVIECAQ